MQCRQCKQEVARWQCGLLSGICPACRLEPSTETKSRVRKYIRRLLFLFAVATTLSIGLTTPVLPFPLFTRNFDAAEWQQGDLRVRGSMARNLINSELLERKEQEEVISLLDEPDIRLPGRMQMRYRVDEGHQSLIHRYPNDLVIRFGKGGEVTYVRLEPRQDEQGNPL